MFQDCMDWITVASISVVTIDALLIIALVVFAIKELVNKFRQVSS